MGDVALSIEQLTVEVEGREILHNINFKSSILYIKKPFGISGLELRVSGHGCLRRFC